MSKNESLSKYLCKVLRHQPDLIHIEVDEEGNVDVEELIEKVNTYSKFTLDRETLETIVKEDQKGRYAFNASHTLIRCVQGHSIPIVGTLKVATPPDLLYHGTATRFLDSIMKEGLKPMRRNYVHLSLDKQTATKVGKRHGKVVILEVDCKQMVEDGIQFKVAENGVWQVKQVPCRYLRICE